MELTLFEKGYLKIGTLIIHGMRRLKIPTDPLFEKKHKIVMRYLYVNHKDLIDKYLSATPPI